MPFPIAMPILAGLLAIGRPVEIINPEIPDTLRIRDQTLLLFTQTQEWEASMPQGLRGPALALRFAGFRGGPECDRGYVTSWSVVNDSLYLVRVGGCQGVAKESPAKFAPKEADAQGRVFAYWVTGVLRTGTGTALLFEPGPFQPHSLEYELTFNYGRLVFVVEKRCRSIPPKEIRSAAPDSTYVRPLHRGGPTPQELRELETK